MSGKTGVGIVGCGSISGIYLKNLGTAFKNVEVLACADLVPEKAAAAAAAYPGVRALTVDALLAEPGIDIVVNLTTPPGHFPIAMQAVAAGKSVYNEKPLTLTREEGQRLLSAAAARGVRVGSAPDTFLGAGLQTCRKLVDEGAIGVPVAAQAFMLCHGHESWHPDPEFYYRKGGGPMFDMGPYYLTALISILGPVRRVTGSTRITFPRRTITSARKHGQTIEVEVPTHIVGVLEFVSGAIGTLVTSFDVWSSEAPRMEIFGAEGTLSLPDPNGFGGPVRLKRMDDREWREMPLTHGCAGNDRGIGVADMAAAVARSCEHRASGALAYHVLDIMHAFHEAASEGRHIMIGSTCARPEALPPPAS